MLYQNNIITASEKMPKNKYIFRNTLILHGVTQTNIVLQYLQIYKCTVK